MKTTEPKKFLTIKGRWMKNEPLLAGLPPEVMAVALAMFYAGFAASLEANLEIADLSEGDAITAMLALQREVDSTVAALMMSLQTSAQASAQTGSH